MSHKDCKIHLLLQEELLIYWDYNLNTYIINCYDLPVSQIYQFFKDYENNQATYKIKIYDNEFNVITEVVCARSQIFPKIYSHPKISYDIIKDMPDIPWLETHYPVFQNKNISESDLLDYYMRNQESIEKRVNLNDTVMRIINIIYYTSLNPNITSKFIHTLILHNFNIDYNIFLTENNPLFTKYNPVFTEKIVLLCKEKNINFNLNKLIQQPTLSIDFIINHILDKNTNHNTLLYLFYNPNMTTDDIRKYSKLFNISVNIQVLANKGTYDTYVYNQRIKDIIQHNTKFIIPQIHNTINQFI